MQLEWSANKNKCTNSKGHTSVSDNGDVFISKQKGKNRREQKDWHSGQTNKGEGNERQTHRSK